ncbi:MAG: NYN domain-containing protein [Chloroflexota bacterium]
MTRRANRPVAPAPLPAGAAATSDPMAGVERVFIDGSNLLFALGRGPARENRPAMGGAPPVPPGAIIGRLRAAFPPSVIVELVFDGRALGGVNGRLATGLRVSYSGHETADRLIDEGVLAQLNADGPAGTWGILVVTDDRGLRNLVVSKGARVAGTAWLARRIGQSFDDAPSRGGPGGRRSGGAAGGGHPGTGSRGGSGSGGGPGSGGRPGQGRATRRTGPSIPGPKAGTTLGHRRPPRAPDMPDRD